VSTATATGTGVHCPRCGTELQPGQDWCLECGTAATTRVLPPPGWGMPAAIVAGAIVLTAVVVAIVVSSLSDNANKSVPSRAAAPAPAPPAHHPARAKPKHKPTATSTTPTKTATTSTTPTTTTPAAAPAGAGKVSTWPAGKSAWTVILVTTDKAGAQRTAKAYAKKGVHAGVINGANFQGLGSYFLVFSGQYGSQRQAQAQVKAVAAKTGQHGYATKLVPKS